MIIADDMQQRGVTIGWDTAAEEAAAEAAALAAAPAVPVAPAKRKGKAAAAARIVHVATVAAPPTGLIDDGTLLHAQAVPG